MPIGIGKVIIQDREKLGFFLMKRKLTNDQDHKIQTITKTTSATANSERI